MLAGLHLVSGRQYSLSLHKGGTEMKTEDFTKQLDKLGVETQLIKGRQRLLVNNQIIGFVG